MYIPDRGDLVWLNFSPQKGHEQAGERPALVISHYEYNKKTGLSLFCPVTSVKKNYPFEVNIPEGHKITGVILSDQIKNLDWKARKVKFSSKIDNEIIEEVVGKLTTIIL